jgi:hypothetical protein
MSGIIRTINAIFARLNSRLPLIQARNAKPIGAYQLEETRTNHIQQAGLIKKMKEPHP